MLLCQTSDFNVSAVTMTIQKMLTTKIVIEVDLPKAIFRSNDFNSIFSETLSLKPTRIAIGLACDGDYNFNELSFFLILFIY